MARIGKFFFFDGSDNLATVFYHHVRSNGGLVESIGCVDNVSSFLEQSSFLLSPSGYKEDTVFTQKPIGANGNLSFTRGSDAWRTNVQGLVERAPYNIVTYSQDFENAAWTKPAGWTVTANATTSPNGDITADLITPTNFNNLSQSWVVTASTNYAVSIYVKRNTTNFTWVSLVFSGGTGVNYGYVINWSTLSISLIPARTAAVNPTFENVGNDWYRISFVCASGNNTSASLQIIPDSQAGTNNIYLWGAQLTEGAYALEYFPTTDRLNVPRLDYSYGTCPALLLEPQRTNLALYSEQFDNAGWNKLNLTASANTTTSPDGTSNADSLVENTASGLHITYQVLTTTATTYSYSCYIKPDTRTRAYLRTDTSAGTARTLFDLTGAGSVVTLAHTSATITLVGNGWYRCTIIFTEGTGAAGRLFAVEGAVGTSVSYTGNGLNAFYLYGAQLEAGAYPTSYIRTEATTVTRLADFFSRNNIYTNNLITSAGGTWYVELRGNVALTPDTTGQGISFGDNLTLLSGNQLQIRSLNTTSRMILAKRVSGTFTSLYTTTSNTCKIVFKWDGSTLDIFENGVKVVSATAFTATALEYLTTNILDAPKYIQAMALYPIALDDVDCELITNPTSSGYSSFASMASGLGYILI